MARYLLFFVIISFAFSTFAQQSKDLKVSNIDSAYQLYLEKKMEEDAFSRKKLETTSTQIHQLSRIN